MKIKEYLNKGKMSPNELALRAHISLPTLYRILRGLRTHRGTAVLISEATGGRVTVEEVLEEYVPSSTKEEASND